MSEKKPEKKNEGITFTRLFPAWLGTEQATLALAANLPAGFCLIGRQKKDGKVMLQQLGQADFLAVAAGPGGVLWTAEKNYLWKWENLTQTGGYKLNDARIYAPRLRIFTSDLGIRDMSVDGHEKLLMASGAYSVIGRATPEASFELVWKPPFLKKIDREDRCGLSGLGLYDQERHCVTMWGRTEEPKGWKKDFNGGGCVMMVHDSSIYCEGLSLPRAPRWRDNELYLLNVGTAEFGKIDSKSKSFVPLCQCPGYPTGLAFIHQWAVISISSTPPPGTEELDLPAKASFASRKIAPFSGVLMVDLRSGDIAHHAYGEDAGFTVNGLALLPQCPVAMAAAPDNDKLENLVTIPRLKGKQAKNV